MNRFESRASTVSFHLLQPLRLYFLDYYQAVREQGFTGYLRINLLLWLFLAIANIIDIQVTYEVFSNGGVEANPLMAFMCTKFGNLSLAFYKGTLLGVLFFLLPFIKAVFQRLLILTCFAYVILLVSHWIRF